MRRPDDVRPGPPPLGDRGGSAPRARPRCFSPDQGAEPQEYREYSEVRQRRAGGKEPASTRSDFRHGLLELRPGPISLGRALSKLGVCSRREAERWIAAGRVAVNDREESSPRRPVDPARDRILVDGRPVGQEAPRIVLAFHKPPGLVTTRIDPGGRATIYEALRDVDSWVFPVGRLDRDTSGLLILTNDTRLAHHLTHPEGHVARTYHALVRGHPDAESLRALREGVDLGGGRLSLPAVVHLLGSPRVEGSATALEAGTTWLEVVLTEGKKRQVRRMLAGLGHEVLTLVRVRVGDLDLGDLAPGEWRVLGPDDEAQLLRTQASF